MALARLPFDHLRSLEVVLTTSCNLSCSYCYQNARGRSRMDWQTLRAALDLLLRSAEPEVSLTFYGGEPLLELALIKRAIRFIEAEKHPDKKFALHLITNGLLLDRDTVRFLARHGVELQISFDGVETAQELRAPGTFHRLDRLLVELRKSEEQFFNQLCSVAIALSSRNVTHLASSLAYFLERGVREIAISPLVTHDSGWKSEMIDVLIEQVAAVLEISSRHHQRTGEIPFVPFQNKAGDARAKNDPAEMCGAAMTDELAVDVDGRVCRCVMLVDSYQNLPDGAITKRLERMRLGSLTDPELGRRLEGYPAAVKAAGIFDGKRGKHSSYRRCAECPFLHQCSICPVSICHIPGNTDPNRVPDLACATNLVVLAARQQFLHDLASDATLDHEGSRRDGQPIGV